MMSASLVLVTTPTDDTFTLAQANGNINVYQGSAAVGKPISSVPVDAASALAVTSVGSTPAVVNIDSNGAPILTAGLVVTGGAVTFNQDLGSFGAGVDVTVNSGATVNFVTSQTLDGLSIESGGLANVLGSGKIVDTNTLSVAGTLSLADNTVSAYAPTSADLTTLQPQIALGSTALSTSGLLQGILSTALDYLSLAGNGSVFAAPVGVVAVSASSLTPDKSTSTVNSTAGAAPATNNVGHTNVSNGSNTAPDVTSKVKCTSANGTANDITVTKTDSSTNPQTITWTYGGAALAANSPAQTYEITLTDNNGDKTVITVTVNP